MNSPAGEPTGKPLMVDTGLTHSRSPAEEYLRQADWHDTLRRELREKAAHGYYREELLKLKKRAELHLTVSQLLRKLAHSYREDEKRPEPEGSGRRSLPGKEDRHGL